MKQQWKYYKFWLECTRIGAYMHCKSITADFLRSGVRRCMIVTFPYNFEKWRVKQISQSFFFGWASNLFNDFENYICFSLSLILLSFPFFIFVPLFAILYATLTYCTHFAHSLSKTVLYANIAAYTRENFWLQFCFTLVSIHACALCDVLLVYVTTAFDVLTFWSLVFFLSSVCVCVYVWWLLFDPIPSYFSIWTFPRLSTICAVSNFRSHTYRTLPMELFPI